MLFVKTKEEVLSYLHNRLSLTTKEGGAQEVMVRASVKQPCTVRKNCESSGVLVSAFPFYGSS